MSPTVFIQESKGHTKSKWELWIAWNFGGGQIVGEFGFSSIKESKILIY